MILEDLPGEFYLISLTVMSCLVSGVAKADISRYIVLFRWRKEEPKSETGRASRLLTTWTNKPKYVASLPFALPTTTTTATTPLRDIETLPEHCCSFHSFFDLSF